MPRSAVLLMSVLLVTLWAALRRQARPRKRSRFLRHALVSVLLPWHSGCAEPLERYSVYRYDADRVLDYLRAHGFPRDDYLGQTWENKTGTKVYFENALPPYAVWIVSADRQEPIRVVLPNDVWIDDENRVQPLPPYAVSAKTTYDGVDQQSGYFYQEDPQSGLIRVGRVDRPDGWLFEFTTDPRKFWPDQICVCGETVILLQVRDGNRESWGEHFNNCWVFNPDKHSGKRWTKQERRLEATCVCADPFARRLLCLSYGGIPWPSSLLLYNVDKGAITNLGMQFGNRFAFILSRDFLSERLRAISGR